MADIKTYPPEKLSLWDRLFNRYKTIPVEEGTESWFHVPNPFLPEVRVNYQKQYVLYHKIDRVTGGFEIIKKYHER